MYGVHIISYDSVRYRLEGNLFPICDWDNTTYSDASYILTFRVLYQRYWMHTQKLTLQ